MLLNFQHWRAQEQETAKVVLLHGMSGEGRIWRPLAARLEKTISVLAPDQRAHGKSHSPEVKQFRAEDYAQDVIDTCQSIGFHPMYIVGHSMGGRTAAALAALKTDWVHGVVLADIPMQPTHQFSENSRLYRFLKDLPPRFETKAEVKPYLEANAPDPSVAKYLAALAIQDPQTGKWGFTFDQQALLKTIEQGQSVAIRPWVESAARKGVRFLVIRGETSHAWTQEEYEKEKAELGTAKNIQFIEMKRTGHALPFERLEDFSRLVKNFIQNFNSADSAMPHSV